MACRVKPATLATVLAICILVAQSSAAPSSADLFKSCQDDGQCPDNLTCKVGHCHDLCEVLDPCSSSVLPDPRCVTVNHWPTCVSAKEETTTTPAAGTTQQTRKESSALPISSDLFKPCKDNSQCPDYLTCKVGYCHDLCLVVLHRCRTTELRRCVTIYHRPICISKNDDTGGSQLAEDVEGTNADATTSATETTQQTRKEETADEGKSTGPGDVRTSMSRGTTPSDLQDTGETPLEVDTEVDDTSTSLKGTSTTAITEERAPTEQPEAEQPVKEAGGSSLSVGEIVAAVLGTVGLVVVLVFIACIVVLRRRDVRDDVEAPSNEEQEEPLTP